MSPDISGRVSAVETDLRHLKERLDTHIRDYGPFEQEARDFMSEYVGAKKEQEAMHKQNSEKLDLINSRSAWTQAIVAIMTLGLALLIYFKH